MPLLVTAKFSNARYSFLFQFQTEMFPHFNIKLFNYYEKGILFLLFFVMLDMQFLEVKVEGAFFIFYFVSDVLIESNCVSK